MIHESQQRLCSNEALNYITMHGAFDGFMNDFDLTTSDFSSVKISSAKTKKKCKREQIHAQNERSLREFAETGLLCALI